VKVPRGQQLLAMFVQEVHQAVQMLLGYFSSEQKSLKKCNICDAYAVIFQR
jgi:hypothetical protein